MEQDYPGQESGREASGHIARCAFGMLGLSILQLTVPPDNTDPVRSWQKTVLVRTDLFRNSRQSHDYSMADIQVIGLSRPGTRIAVRM